MKYKNRAATILTMVMILVTVFSGCGNGPVPPQNMTLYGRLAIGDITVEKSPMDIEENNAFIMPITNFSSYPIEVVITIWTDGLVLDANEWETNIAGDKATSVNHRTIPVTEDSFELVFPFTVSEDAKPVALENKSLHAHMLAVQLEWKVSGKSDKVSRTSPVVELIPSKPQTVIPSKPLLFLKI